MTFYHAAQIRSLSPLLYFVRDNSNNLSQCPLKNSKETIRQGISLVLRD